VKLTRQVSQFAALATMLVVLTALSGCGGSSANTDSAELDGAWTLESLGGVSDLTPADPSVTSTLTLEDGQASGAGGVNTFRGTYESPADGELSFSPLASTRMAGPEAAMTQEAAFLKALEATERFELDGDRLVLGNAANDTLAVLRPASP
jgi:heat shock protein HslJ